MTSSRWVTQFESHRFRANWTTLKQLLADANVDDESLQVDIQELVRLKRVVAYLDSVIEKIDAELVPKQIWESFASQLEPCLSNMQQYVVSKNVAHIVQANDHADNLLSYVRPYMVMPQQGLEAL